MDRESWKPRCEFLAAAGYHLRFNGPSVRNHPRTNLADAVDCTGRRVLLKVVSTSRNPHEISLARLLSSAAHADPANHYIPVLDVLQDPHDPDLQLLVMPLCIGFNRPKFDTVGEVVDFIRQIFEGIRYLHGIYIAHRDCNFTNVVQDPAVYPDGDFHPSAPWMDAAHEHLSRPITRTECWPRYHIIDFGLSRQYDPRHGPPLEHVIMGGDKTPPEHFISLGCNPFPTDIYYLGNLVRGLARPTWRPGGISYAPPHPPLSFLLPLIDQMMHKDPRMRPTIGDVVEQFAELCQHLTKAHLRRPARPLSWTNSLSHRLRQAKRAWAGVPPLPPYSHTPPTPLSDEMRAFFTQVPKSSALSGCGSASCNYCNPDILAS
ncbi:kinase-like domain-containing protein [Mycena belliarum]|uniref:Kinase-like domain-containing protein n=1 Tax=Mycena belliarum TaxID=1033014 RepID=A0AAD6TYU2_9AGAR|nr:kinase-like domain-containing protein [Mycena belliae]